MTPLCICRRMSLVEMESIFLRLSCPRMRTMLPSAKWQRPSLGGSRTKSAFSTASQKRLEHPESPSDKLPQMPTPPQRPVHEPTPLLSSQVQGEGEGDMNSESTSSQAERETSNHSTLDASSTEPMAKARAPRDPRSVQAIHLKPLKRKAQYGVPSCDLQLRSYSVRNVEFFADFALRAAYYLHLPASGPVPLPRIYERWTVPRSNFIFKKSQENFERITLRRLIQIQDGNPETVEIWLAFLRKHAYYGIGMKANFWQHEKLGVGKTMDVSLENLRQAMEPKWAHFGRRKTLETSEKAYEMMTSEIFQQSADTA